MNKKYLVNGNQICFIVKNEFDEIIGSGVFLEEHNGPEKEEYLAWVAEGNTAEEAE